MIRVKLLKIGAQIRVSVRRVRVAFSESFPAADLFAPVLCNIQAVPVLSGAP